jgi:hypothetical protein
MFGTSGLLYQSNKLMYDDLTKNLWSNLWGKPVFGSLLTTGRTYALKRLTLTQTRWREWRELHSDTKVLALPSAVAGRTRTSRTRLQAETRTYAAGSAYSEYREGKDLLFPTVIEDDRLAPKEWVYGVVIEEKARAYPVKELVGDDGVINDLLGDKALVLLVDTRSGTEDYWRQGGAVRAYERKSHKFHRDVDAQLLDETNQVWQLFEEKLVNAETGETLARLEGSKAYWFGWVSFYPMTEVWESPSPR